MDEALNMDKSQIMMKIRLLKRELNNCFNCGDYNNGRAWLLAWHLMNYIQDLGPSKSDKFAIDLSNLTEDLLRVSDISTKDKDLANNYLQHI